jgi:hypothetical protein
MLMLKGFKPSEFLHIMRKMVSLLNDVLIELRAIRELLEEEGEFMVTWDSGSTTWSGENDV